MSQVYCTLYNSNYLDKGLVLYDSLCECAKDFKLYVLCMDDKCYEVLTDLNQENHIPIKLSEFEAGDEELIKAKGNRSFAEYCWTCTPSIILYIIQKHNESICTYIDADMYFYHDPMVLIGEMLEAGKSVMMVPHRFVKNNSNLADKVGTYCVEFNTFKNDDDGLKVLKYWHLRCLECCSNLGDGIHWGDQKYMDEWPVLFPNIVHVCNNAGAGIASWNIENYEQYDMVNNTIVYRPTGVRLQVVFYHFQSIFDINKHVVETGVNGGSLLIDYLTVDYFYEPYIVKIDSKRLFLELDYSLHFGFCKHPSLKTSWKSVLKTTWLYRKFIFLFRSYRSYTPYYYYRK